jgi:hypothetical protein
VTKQVCVRVARWPAAGHLRAMKVNSGQLMHNSHMYSGMDKSIICNEVMYAIDCRATCGRVEQRMNESSQKWRQPRQPQKQSIVMDDRTYFSLYFNVTFVVECCIVIDYIFLVVVNTVDYLCHFLLGCRGEAFASLWWSWHLVSKAETCPSNLLSLLGEFVTKNCGGGKCNWICPLRWPGLNWHFESYICSFLLGFFIFWHFPLFRKTTRAWYYDSTRVKYNWE